MANAQSAKAGPVRIAGATRPALTAARCRAHHWWTMAKDNSHQFRCGRLYGHYKECDRHRVPHVLLLLAMLVLLWGGAAAHPPEAAFADWFRSLKEPGTEGTPGGGVSCCSPASDCQMTDYETDADGRY